MTRSRELLLKVGLFGLQDLRRLAPIGDIGYLNATSFYHDYERSGLISDLMRAFDEQRDKYGWDVLDRSSGWPCDHTSYCPQLGLTWSVDSSG